MSLPTALQAPLTAYSERLRAIFGERLHEVRLFGSHARGEADDGSDVDVLVLVDGLTDVEVGLAASEAAPIVIESGVPITPLPMSTAHFEELRKQERLLARVLDDEGVAI